MLPERQRRQALGGAGELGIEVADEGAELLQSVLDRGARHEDRVVGTADLLKSAAGTSSGGVLDLVRLVDHERVQVLERAVSEEAGEGREGGDRDAAFALPLAERLGAVRAVQSVRGEVALAPDLAQPVRDHRCRADHQGVRGAVAGEVGDRGERLDGLAQPHLVADDHLPLPHRESRPEVLVGPERGDVQQRGVQLHAVDLADQLLGEVAVGVLGDLLLEAQLGEQGEVVAGMRREVLRRRGAGTLVRGGGE